MKNKPLIDDGLTLVGAHFTSGTIIPTYDDGFGDKLWIMQDSIGIRGIVRALSWEDAFEIAEDEFYPEASETVEELIKEYGPQWSEHPLFEEAYGFRPNGRNDSDKIGHGIYAKDLNGETLTPLTEELIKELDIVLEVAVE